MRRNKIVTALLADCFGCHMSFLDGDERLVSLTEHVASNLSPFTDIEHCCPCAIGLIEDGVCSAENVHGLCRSSTSKTQ